MAHNHTHNTILQNYNKAFIIGIALNSAYVIIEMIYGVLTNSMALISDAGHNLSDVFSLVLSLVAFRLTKIKPTETYTYGFKKSTILASLFNAVILLVAVGSIGWEAIQRFFHPQEVSGGVVAIVAGIGIIINAVSAFLFFKDKEKDLNLKGAYMHLFADALVSIGVVIAGIIITYTHWLWIDPTISLVIMVVIVFGTWDLLKESLRLSMDAVPKNIDVEAVKKSTLAVEDVTGIHHIHIWANGTTQTAATAHIVIKQSLASKQVSGIVKNIKHAWEHLGISHSTIEIETSEEECSDVKSAL
jgi:cobalt-zinc-cadmium efflux system protein